MNIKLKVGVFLIWGCAAMICADQASATILDLAPSAALFGPTYSQGGYTFTDVGASQPNVAFLNWVGYGEPQYNANGSTNADITLDYGNTTVAITNNAAQAFRELPRALLNFVKRSLP